MILIGKIAFLLLAIIFGLPWVGMLIRGQSIHWMQTTVTAVGVVGFVTLQWLL